MVRRALIDQPYKLKLETDKGCRPVWTYLNDDDLLPFFQGLEFEEAEGEGGLYQPGMSKGEEEKG
jgi:hypothetical protein